MKQVYKIDSEGYYVKPMLVENTPSNCVEEAPPNGLYKAKFVDGQWVEGLSQSEVDEIKNTPQPKTEIELLKEKQDLMQQALDDLILGGAL